MSYFGKEPCVGCNKTGEELPRDTAKGLCNECKLLLSSTRSVREFESNFVNGGEIVVLEFRDVDRYLRSIDLRFDDEIRREVNNFALLFLMSVEIKFEHKYVDVVHSKGVDGTNRPWFRGRVKRMHWELLEGFLNTLDRLFKEKLLVVADEKKKSLEEGRNFLIQQLKNDVISKI